MKYLLLFTRVRNSINPGRLPQELLDWLHVNNRCATVVEAPDKRTAVRMIEGYEHPINRYIVSKVMPVPAETDEQILDHTCNIVGSLFQTAYERNR